MRATRSMVFASPVLCWQVSLSLVAMNAPRWCFAVACLHYLLAISFRHWFYSVSCSPGSGVQRSVRLGHCKTGYPVCANRRSLLYLDAAHFSSAGRERRLPMFCASERHRRSGLLWRHETFCGVASGAARAHKSVPPVSSIFPRAVYWPRRFASANRPVPPIALPARTRAQRVRSRQWPRPRRRSRCALGLPWSTRTDAANPAAENAAFAPMSVPIVRLIRCGTANGCARLYESIRSVAPGAASAVPTVRRLPPASMCARLRFDRIGITPTPERFYGNALDN